MWKEKLGVNVTMSDMEFAVLSDRRHSQDYAARPVTPGAVTTTKPRPSCRCYDSKSGAERPGWANADVDKLLADAKVAADPNPMYTKIEEIAAEEAPIMPIYFYAKVFMQKPTVKGWPVRQRRADLVRQGHVHHRRVSV